MKLNLLCSDENQKIYKLIQPLINNSVLTLNGMASITDDGVGVTLENTW